MLKYSDTDRWRFRGAPDIAVGDIGRWPARLGASAATRGLWEVVACGGQGVRYCIYIRQRHTGTTRLIAMHWWRSENYEALCVERTLEVCVARHRRRHLR